MWKLVVVICALGNPCVLMEQDPMKYYKTKSECMANASAKHGEITQGLQDVGYIIENSGFDCEQDHNAV